MGQLLVVVDACFTAARTRDLFRQVATAGQAARSADRAAMPRNRDPAVLPPPGIAAGCYAYNDAVAAAV